VTLTINDEIVPAPTYKRKERLCTLQFIDLGCRLSPAPSPLLRQLAYRSIAMSDAEQTGGSSKQYRNIHITEGARAHLGDTYNISQFLKDLKRSISKD
jgi:hypothetical protein